MVTCAQALAGPWTLPRDGAYTQLAVLGQRVAGEDAVRGELYGEYGVTPRWTATGQLEGVTFPELSGFDQFAYRATLRRQLFQQGRFLLAFEGGVIGGEAIGGTIGGCYTVGGEARVSIGGGGRSKRGLNWFGFADAIVREHGNCRRQRFETGFGREIVSNWFTVNKLYLETGTGDAQSAKLETILSRRFGNLDLGVGYRQEFGGRFQEAGIIISLERRF